MIPVGAPSLYSLGPDAETRSLSTSPDGRFLAIATSRAVHVCVLAGGAIESVARLETYLVLPTRDVDVAACVWRAAAEPGAASPGGDKARVHTLALVTRERVVVLAFTEVLHKSAGWAQWLLGEEPQDGEPEVDPYRRPVAYALEAVASVAPPPDSTFTSAAGAVDGALVVALSTGALLPVSWIGGVAAPATAPGAPDAVVSLARTRRVLLGVTSAGALVCYRCGAAGDGGRLEWVGVVALAPEDAAAAPVAVAARATAAGGVAAVIGHRDGSVAVWCASDHGGEAPRWERVGATPVGGGSVTAVSWRTSVAADVAAFASLHGPDGDAAAGAGAGAGATLRVWTLPLSAAAGGADGHAAAGAACVAVARLPSAAHASASAGAVAWAAGAFDVLVGVRGAIAGARDDGDDDSDDDADDGAAPVGAGAALAAGGATSRRAPRAIHIVRLPIADAASGAGRTASHSAGDAGAFLVTADAVFVLDAAGDGAASLPRLGSRHATVAVADAPAAAADVDAHALAWRAFAGSPHYMPMNAPTRLTTASGDGALLAVAGARGAAVFNLRRREWHVFPTPRQEQAVAAVAMAWLGSRVLLLVHRGDEGAALHLHAYPRARLDADSRLCAAPLGLPSGVAPRAMATGATYVHHAGDATAAVWWLAIALGPHPQPPLAAGDDAARGEADDAPTAVALYRLVLRSEPPGSSAHAGGSGAGAPVDTVLGFPITRVVLGADVLPCTGYATGAGAPAFRGSAADAGAGAGGPLTVEAPPLAGADDVVAAAEEAAERSAEWRRGAAEFARGAGLRVSHVPPPPHSSARDASGGSDGGASPISGGPRRAATRAVTSLRVPAADAPAATDLRSLTAVAPELVAVLALPSQLLPTVATIGVLGGAFRSPHSSDTASAGAHASRGVAPQLLLTSPTGGAYVLDCAGGTLHELALTPPVRALLGAAAGATGVRTAVVAAASVWGGSPRVSLALIATADAVFTYTPGVATAAATPTAAVSDEAVSAVALAAGGASPVRTGGGAPSDAPGGTGTPAPRPVSDTDSEPPPPPPPGILVRGRPLQLDSDSDGGGRGARAPAAVVGFSPLARAAAGAFVVLPQDDAAAAALPTPPPTVEAEAAPRGGAPPRRAPAPLAPSASTRGDGGDAPPPPNAPHVPAVPAGVRLVHTLHAVLKAAIVHGLFARRGGDDDDGEGSDGDDPLDAATALGAAALKRGPPHVAHAALRQLLHDAVDDEPDAAAAVSGAAGSDGVPWRGGDTPARVAGGRVAAAARALLRLRRIRAAAGGSGPGSTAHRGRGPSAAGPPPPPPPLPPHWVLTEGGVGVDLAAALAPSALTLLRTLGGALLAYMAKKRVPAAAVFGDARRGDAAAQHAELPPPPPPPTAHACSPFLEAVLALLRRLDVALDVVCAVGRTVEEPRLVRLFPAAGAPRALLREALRRAATASGSVSSTPIHSRASLRFLRVAAAFMLLAQEFAWRAALDDAAAAAPATETSAVASAAAAAAPQPSADAVVRIVNANLADAVDLLAACGVPPDVAALLVGPLLSSTARARTEAAADPAAAAAAALVDDDILPTVADDEPATLKGLRSIVGTTTAYCARLRVAAESHVATALAAAAAAARDGGATARGAGGGSVAGSLLGGVAYVLGLGFGRGGGKGSAAVPAVAGAAGARTPSGGARPAPRVAFASPSPASGGGGDGSGDAHAGALPPAAATDAIVALLHAARVPLLASFSTLVHRKPGDGPGGGAFGLVLAPVNPVTAVHGAGRGGDGGADAAAAALPFPRPAAAAVARGAAAARARDASGDDDEELAAVAAALRELTVQQHAWLGAQIRDTAACIGGLAEPLVTLPAGAPGAAAAGGAVAASVAVGDIIQRVGHHVVTGVPFDSAVAALEAAPRATALRLLRIVDVPAIDVLAALLL